MSSSFIPRHSEVLVVIGAGATAKLGMPQSSDQSDVFHALSNDNANYEKVLKVYFKGNDLSKIVSFFKALDGDNEKIENFSITKDDINEIKNVYRGCDDENLLKNRILELRRDYDWNALRKIIGVCPHNESDDTLVYDVYSIIDKKLQANQSIKIVNGTNEEILPLSRIQGARNFLTMFINLLFSSAWNNICNDENSDEFLKYKKFINTFTKMMQDEGHKFYDKGFDVNSRDFYLFSCSFVSLNFEMVFPWLLMNSHREFNKDKKTYINDHPMKLWLDYGVEHRGRKTVNGKVVLTLEFAEAVASRENEDDHIGTELNRTGKFYFAHGSSNWRECPVCGRMTFYNGGNYWEYKSKKLIPPFPIPVFEPIDEKSLTSKELEWRKNLHYDSLQCMHCGSETKALDAPMIMQTMLKTTPTSFLEEIQRNVKVALSNARHIVLLGYRLPPDDTIWYEAFAEAVKGREKGQEAYCSVVVGYEGKGEWLSGKELEMYVEKYVKYDNAEAYGVSAIRNAWAIFGKEKVRAWTGGIPQVFGNCTEFDVKGVFYPDFVNWDGTRLEK